MKFTTRSRYGTRLLLDLVLHGAHGPVSSATISGRQDIPSRYLERLARELGKAGFIASMRGAKGGHVLIRDPRHITVGDVVRVLDGIDEDPYVCVNDAYCPRSAQCMLRNVWNRANHAALDVLSSITLADLAKVAGTCPEMKVV